MVARAAEEGMRDPSEKGWWERRRTMREAWGRARLRIHARPALGTDAEPRADAVEAAGRA
ncbi:hypothetical protein GCM10027515_17130 [Schumannella luteola]